MDYFSGDPPAALALFGKPSQQDSGHPIVSGLS
jgi:hypothetical protein